MSATRLYTVQPGDSLTQIAQRELGSIQRWPQIYDANRGQLRSPSKLEVGIRLRIPTP